MIELISDDDLRVARQWVNDGLTYGPETARSIIARLDAAEAERDSAERLLHQARTDGGGGIAKRGSRQYVTRDTR